MYRYVLQMILTNLRPKIHWYFRKNDKKAVMIVVWAFFVLEGKASLCFPAFFPFCLIWYNKTDIQRELLRSSSSFWCFFKKESTISGKTETDVCKSKIDHFWSLHQCLNTMLYLINLWVKLNRLSLANTASISKHTVNGKATTPAPKYIIARVQVSVRGSVVLQLK